MRAIIYGNGPSLLTAPLSEPGVHRYGVNRSYEVAYAENWCKADARALENRPSWFAQDGFYEAPRSDLHVQPQCLRHAEPNPLYLEGPVYLWKKAPTTSGPFAMHVAASQSHDKIYLAGFDNVRRRFYEEEDNLNISQVNYRKEALRVILEWPKVDWRIWRDEKTPGWYPVYEVLHGEN
jgi:hypothetical protein